MISFKIQAEYFRIILKKLGSFQRHLVH
jgi:hypothetical protein